MQYCGSQNLQEVPLLYVSTFPAFKSSFKIYSYCGGHGLFYAFTFPANAQLIPTFNEFLTDI